MRENIFLTLGSPLVDIIASVDRKFLNNHGLKFNDAVKATEKHKQLFQDLVDFQPKYQAGGCALNTARALQWTLNIPKFCMVFGAIGKDNYSEILKRQLNNESVNYIFEEIPGEETGKCAVLLNGRNRSLCTDLGASKYFDFKHLKNKKVWNVVENAKFYYVPGFFFGVSFECIMEVAEHSFLQGKIFTFNLSAPFLSQMYKKELEILLPFVDIIFGNESEVRAYAKVLNFNSNNLHEILLYINNLPKKKESRRRITVITRGPKPVCLVQNNCVTEYVVNEIADSRIVDTNAAGDAFVGAFMAEYIMEKSIDKCILAGIFVAIRILYNVGCSF
ncbi:hypothetical protein ILUMI_07161 [Ignelater luminosus]|uniref:Adenosine kinase n=1 Tax=Ignelater luminosus TaxID=2038154 RepID=A0A8K0D706_IGNLU|nr:hypothetical protein ILUMI_07161 [Ignelater luminosus]